MSAEDRLNLLYIVLRIISGENSRIPPLPYKLGINKFSADTETERETLAGTFRNRSAIDEFGEQFGRFPSPSRRQLLDIPMEKDWVKEGAVTEVTDQGRCGCCWAISVMGASEGAAAITPENEGFLEVLSFQQLISCDEQNWGCDGGMSVSVFAVWSSSNNFPVHI